MGYDTLLGKTNYGIFVLCDQNYIRMWASTTNVGSVATTLRMNGGPPKKMRATTTVTFPIGSQRG
uniref:Uncharacterized protein n=1 Tax=Onchocerca volvulus TaxID=6282 RepID=A0A8R1TRE2_ONCVO